MFRRILIFTAWASLVEIALIATVGTAFWDAIRPFLAAFMQPGVLP